MSMALLEKLICVGLHIFLFFCLFTNVAGQTTAVAEASEGETNVMLTFTIPKESENSLLITIKQNGTDVAYVYLSDLSSKITDAYKTRLTLTDTSINDRKVTFTLDSVKEKDAGSYECYKDTLVNLYEACGIRLIIIKKPDPPVFEPVADGSHVVGQKLMLTCQTRSKSLPSDHGLQSVVEWWIDPAFGDTSDRITELANNTLVLSVVEREDKGKIFRCRSTDKPADASKQQWSDYSNDFVVTPKYGPSPADIVISPQIQYGSTKSVILTSPVTFSCTVTCEPDCRVFWEFKAHASDSFAQAPNDYSSGGSLNIRSVPRSSHGEYQCVGENTLGRVEHKFYLNVYYMLTPIPYINGVQTEIGQTIEGDGDVVLKCDLDSNPMPSVSWHAPDARILESSVFQGPDEITSDSNLLIHRYSSEIVLQNLMCSDSGQYQCQSTTSQMGSMYKNITMEVKCKPRAVVEGKYHLRADYVWEIPYDLYVKFLVESWPKPTLARVESEIDTVRQSEGSNVDIVLQHAYERKQHLTLVEFTSKRQLTLEDDGRTFIVTLDNSDFQTSFRFTIHASGPPNPVTDVTTDKVTHNAAHLSWLPGFNGGNRQTFSVLVYEPRGDAAGADQWVPLVTDIPDSQSPSTSVKERVKAVVDGLASSTEYRLQIMAVNENGNVTEEHVITTLSAPASSMAGGTIAGIVISIIIILIIIAVLLYLFVFRKRCGKGGGVNRLKPAAKVRAVYRHFRGQNGSADGAKVRPKERRPIFLGKSDEPKAKDYHNVPTESTDPTLLEDDYANANEIRRPMLKEPMYSNSSPSTENLGDHNGSGDDVRILNEDGLHYASIDFSGAKAGKGDKKAKKPKKPKRGKDVKAVEEEVAYSDIDFVKTKAKELEMKREDEEKEKEENEEEDPYQVVNNGPGTTV